MFDLVILDCDGVLVDSERISVRSDARVLGELGWPLSEDEIVERFVGRSHGYMVAEIRRAIGQPLTDGLFLHAAAAQSADPTRCAVVEDTPFGLGAARAAGMRAFAHAGGLVPTERLRGPGTTIFYDMRELPDLLDPRG